MADFLNIMRKAICRLTLVAALVLLVSACGSNKSREDVGKPAKLQDFERRVVLQRQWSTGIGNGQGSDDDRLTLGVSAEGVCAASVNGVLRCYNHSGKRQWKRRIEGRLSAGVGVSNRFLLVADADGKLLVLSRDSGELVWEKPLDSQILAAPQSNDEVVVVQTTDGRLLGFRAGDGEQIWEYITDEPRLTLKGTSTPVIDSGVVYTGLANGKIVALNVDNGALLFDAPVAIASGVSEVERLVDVDGSPLLVDGSIYAVSHNGNAFAFDRRSGRPQWRYKTSSYNALANGLNKIYLVDDQSRLFALNRNSGDERWEQSEFLNRELGTAIVFSGYLLVADYKGYVHALSQVDGRVVGRKRVDRSGISTPMHRHGDQLYVYSDDGKLAAYRLVVK